MVVSPIGNVVSVRCGVARPRAGGAECARPGVRDRRARARDRPRTRDL